MQDMVLMKLILHLSSLMHCHIIKSDYMIAYLMSMKSPTEIGLFPVWLIIWKDHLSISGLVWILTL
jgi:hypothetical protein